jgi:ribose transport system substrate-binding protein
MKTRYAALLSIILVAAVGCGSKGDETGASSGKLKIAVIPKGSTHEYWKSVHAGADKAGKELGVDIIWKGPVKEDDRTSQQDVVSDFVTKKVDGMVLAPLDADALVPSVDEATEAKIPVVIIDSALSKKEYVSFVATDNYKGGTMAGEYLSKILGGKGKVVMMRYQEGSASTMERERGFMDAIKKSPGITVVSSNQYGGATTESAQRTAENILSGYKQANGLSIDGIFCPNESTCVGMLRVLEDAGVAGKVKYVGFDSSPTLLDALKKGEINGLILQDPVNMGYVGVKTLVEHIKGQKVPESVDTGATLATKENMDDPKVKKLLEPPVER